MRSAGTQHRKKNRLFIALPLEVNDGDLKPVSDFLNTFTSKLKIVSPAGYHLTMKFLGETDDETFSKLAEGFPQINVGLEPIKYKLEGMGVFPENGKPRIIWHGLVFFDNKLQELLCRIEKFAEQYGFKKEQREFRPHLTIARVRRDARLPDRLLEFINLNKNTLYAESFFDKLVLFKSELFSNGPRYSEVKVIRLD